MKGQNKGHVAAIKPHSVHTKEHVAGTCSRDM